MGCGVTSEVSRGDDDDDLPRLCVVVVAWKGSNNMVNGSGVGDKKVGIHRRLIYMV
jgi:hypothetical protein